MFEWIDFGQVAAERDDLLPKYFYDSGVLEKVTSSPSTFLVLGRKGAGKTAVFKRFGEDYEKYLEGGDCSIALSLNNYDWAVHGLMSNPNKAPSLAFIESWKYFIYVNAILAVEHVNMGSKYTKRLRKMIERIHGAPAPTLLQNLSQKLLRLSKLKLPSGGFDLENGDIDALSVSAGEVEFAEVEVRPSLQMQLSQSMSNVISIMEVGLKKHTQSSGRIFVTFDRIDEAWVIDSIEQIKPMISGLIGAADAINQSFAGKLRPLIFLREDIFDVLSLNDKNKLRSDCGQLLAWRRETLDRVIMERVNYYARESGHDEQKTVDDLFDRSKMRQQRKPLDYILARTMMRPRDIIKFLDLVKKDMVERRDNPFDGEDVNREKLECAAIYNAEAQYSAWLREEIIDEWVNQFPLVEGLLSAIEAVGSTTFTPKKFQRALVDSGIAAEKAELLRHLRFLFENSIIAFKVGQSQIWRFKCTSPSQGFVEASTYKVHDGLVPALSLKEPRS